MPLVKKEFTSNSSWTAPAGITNVLVYGYGGGGGGCSNYYGGGGASWARYALVAVVPNTSYTITIGGGGNGGTSVGINVGASGTDTTFGSLATFAGAAGGGGSCGGSIRGGYGDGLAGYPGHGGDNLGPGNGMNSLEGYTGGTYYDTGANLTGGGGAGPGGNGANAGAGAGASAAANSGGGGAAGYKGGGNDAGGNGGSGKLIVLYWE